MTAPKKDYEFNAVEVIRFALKWKWQIITITVLAAVASIVFSSPAFITPKYKSTVIFYPAKNNSVSGGILEDATARDVDASEFGEEENAEQALQILGSSQLMARVVDRFHLMEHYHIDPNGSMPYTQLGNKINSNIKFKRTEFLSIEISVLDESPQMAANIANGISQIYDSVRTDIQRQVASKAFAIIEAEYFNKLKEVDSLQQQVNDISRGRKISAGSLAGGKNESSSDAMKRQQEIASSGADVGTLMRLSESLNQQVEQMNHLKEKYRKAKADMEEYIPHKFEISPASPAEQKAYPLRSVIVIVSTFSAFVLSIIVLIIFDRFRKFKQLLKEQPESNQ